MPDEKQNSASVTFGGTTTSTSPAAMSFSAPTTPPAADAATPTAPAAFTPATLASPPAEETTLAAANPTSDSAKHYQVQARYLKFVKDDETGKLQWTSGGTGNLALEYSKDGKRVVIRDNCGKSIFLVELPTDIRIVEQKTVKGAKKRFIQFIAKIQYNDEAIPVRLQTNEKFITELYEKIRELGHMKVN